jgi:predicted HicB family RNase H-like nuclease
MTKTEIKRAAAQYPKFVEWSNEDNCFIGRCPMLFIGGIHGDDEARVYRELCLAAEEWVEVLDKDNQPLPVAKRAREYSGKFVVRTTPELHQRLALKAMAAGESLNNLIVKTLTTKA